MTSEPLDTREGPVGGGRASQITASTASTSPNSTPGVCYLACGSECTKTCPQAAIARIPEETRAALVECGNERIQLLAVRYYGLPDHVRHTVRAVVGGRYGVLHLSSRVVPTWELDLLDGFLAVAEASAA